jgi:hypothetical protein
MRDTHPLDLANFSPISEHSVQQICCFIPAANIKEAE